MSVLKKHTFGLLNATYINNVYIIIIFMLTCSYIHPSQTIFSTYIKCMCVHLYT